MLREAVPLPSLPLFRGYYLSFPFSLVFLVKIF